MQVKDIMTQGVECISPDATLQEAATRMKDLDVGSLPVCGENDRLVGMITDRDVTVRCTASGGHPEDHRVRDVMTPGIVYCFEDQDIAEASRLMKEKQIRRLVVLNRDRKLTGIVSLGDLAVHTGDDQLAGNTLEAISEPATPAV